LGRIIVLDEQTRNLIAAGEVVERPVSAVKELVENSIDAGAGNIVVNLEEGGLAAITVADDGTGMLKEDLILAFERHATSKIKQTSDLSKVLTLGFRGEAIPSIAAVSKMSITTRMYGEITGCKAEAEGGCLVDVTPVGCPPGTKVEVKNLFYNTPARRKTMKSPFREGTLCAEIISRLALARPDISFELKNKGKRVFYSPGTGQLIDSVTAVYGISQAREMLKVLKTENGLSIIGYTGKPSISRSRRDHIIVIINGRYVNCPEVAGAVDEAYRTLLPHGRRPVAVLLLELSPELLDINVHPAKIEVRLLEQDSIVRLVTGSIKEALQVKEIIPQTVREYISSTSAEIYNKEHQLNVFKPTRVIANISSINYTEAGSFNSEKPVSQLFEPSINLQTGRSAQDSVDYTDHPNHLPVLKVLGQLPPVYILAGGDEGLYIIDQHAAHERILYEENLSAQGKEASQCLVVPVTLDLDHREASLLLDKVLWFSKAGFIIEHFGGNTFLIRGVPPNFPIGQEKVFVMDILDYFLEIGPGATFVEFFDRVASAIACRKAVKAGDKLALSSMDTLLQRLSNTANPFTCPHGRPTLIHLSNKTLETRFKR